jgi:aspartyl-tRNA(Asn)/glutamyl-tRNA(Gln) amidotransferase subunit B
MKAGTVSTTAARRVFEQMIEQRKPAAELLDMLDLEQVSDDDQIRSWAAEVTKQHADAVTKYRAGDVKVLGFLMGELMKKSRGKADPRKANEVMRSLLA